MSMKNPMTLAGIEPATFRFVAQHLNHCATAGKSDYITEFNSLRKTMLEHLKPCGNYMYHIDIFCIRTQCTYALRAILTNKYRFDVQQYEVSISTGQRLRCLGNVESVFMHIVDEWQSLKADIWQSLRLTFDT